MIASANSLIRSSFSLFDTTFLPPPDLPLILLSITMLQTTNLELFQGVQRVHRGGGDRREAWSVVEPGVKMVLSGEGSDEVFGGYLYFHKAPNKEEFHHETVRKIKALHQYDCLRANKATSAWGLEARVPFLDKEFINVAMAVDPEWKLIKPEEGRIEKWVLRRAFDDEKRPYLPKHILYRQKEQFSDGVGYSWIDGLKAHAAKHVTDMMMQNAAHIFLHNTPTTKEAYYYRMIFERFFPQNSATLTVPGGASVACSTAKAVEWDASWANNLDPSGRAALGVHLSAYENHAADASAGATMMPPKIIGNNIPRKIEIGSPGVAIHS